MSILKILESKPNVSLVFTNMTKDLDSDGNLVLLLDLEEPINVMGSGRINNNLTGDSIQIGATDVVQVKVHQRNIELLEEAIKENKATFTWDEAAKKGSLTCDFRLDVSRNEEVWLTKESFVAFGRNSRNNRNSERKNKLADKLRENATKQTFSGAAANATPATPVVVANS